MNYSNINECIERLQVDMNIPGCVVGIVKNNYIDNVLSLGHSKKEGDTPISRTLKFPISCCTKMFTALTALKMNVDVDKPINEYCKEIIFPDETINKFITIRDLFIHRSGLRPNTLWTYLSRNINMDDTLDKIRYLKYEPFRNNYIYTNYSYSIIGYILQSVAKKQYFELINEHVFNEAGMTQSTFFSKDEIANNRIIDIKPHVSIDGVLKQSNILQMQLLNPASGIIMNFDDALNFVLFLLEVFKSKKYPLMFKPNILCDEPRMYNEIGWNKYALGLYVQDYYGYDVYYHNGYILGYSSYIAIIPELNMGIVSFCNRDKSVFPRIVALHILESVLSKSSTNWKGRLIREQKCGEYAKDSFERQKKLSKDIKPKHNIIKFNKNALHGEIVLGKESFIYINGYVYKLNYLDNGIFYTYIEDLNDYLIIKFENEHIKICGTNIIDSIEIV